jgi:hypothetical protein
MITDICANADLLNREYDLSWIYFTAACLPKKKCINLPDEWHYRFFNYFIYQHTTILFKLGKELALAEIKSE